MSRTLIGGLMLVAVTAAVTSQVVSQGTTGKDDAWSRYGVPSENHEILNRLAGKWNHQVSVWQSPEAEPETFTMAADYRWVLGGRFLVGNYSGYIGGEYFQAKDVVGYDNVRGRYNSLWVDNETTAFTLASGRYDRQQNALILEGTQDDVERQILDEPFKFVYRFVGADQITIEVSVPGPDGAMVRRVKVDATRAE